MLELLTNITLLRLKKFVKCVGVAKNLFIVYIVQQISNLVVSKKAIHYVVLLSVYFLGLHFPTFEVLAAKLQIQVVQFLQSEVKRAQDQT
jgi:hypothetical protein